mmetsp:Transcript_118993/g.167239  ORF Transcript_118993/g.167239 Transcript_118993/m.167239 type:complete len:203 (+) Transcript_118993:11-619(+)
MSFARAVIVVVFLVAAACAVPASDVPLSQRRVANEPIVAAMLPNSMNVTSTYTLSWGVFNNTIGMLIDVYAEAWVGIGWHEADSFYNGMQNADFVTGIFYFDRGLLVQDRWCSCSVEGEPATDFMQGGTYDITFFDGYQTVNPDGAVTVSSIYFERLLDTGDVGYDHVISDAEQRVIWAYGTSNTFAYHGDNRGQFNLNFLA